MNQSPQNNSNHSLEANLQNGSIVSNQPWLVQQLQALTYSLLHSSILGFPRQGVLRDLKKATEAYWADKLSQEELLNEGKRLRLAHWKIQKDAGVDIIPSNDFAYYDHVLDHIQLFGVIPPRYSKYNLSQTDELFAMGRGLQKPAENIDVPALVSIFPF